MKEIVAAIQMNSGSDWQKNLRHAEMFINQACAQGAKLVLLPENFATFAMNRREIAEYNKEIVDRVCSKLTALAQKHQVLIVGGTLPVLDESTQKFFARCFVYGKNGEAVTQYDKVHLFAAYLENGNERYEESQDYCAGNELVIIDTGDYKIGLAICYDVRFPEMFRVFFQEKVDAIVLPSAFTLTTGRAHWLNLLKTRAVENACYLLAANQAGQHENGRQTFGHSALIDPWGREVSVAGNHVPQLVMGDIDASIIEQARKSIDVHASQVIRVNAQPLTLNKVQL